MDCDGRSRSNDTHKQRLKSEGRCCGGGTGMVEVPEAGGISESKVA